MWFIVRLLYFPLLSLYFEEGRGGGKDGFFTHVIRVRGASKSNQQNQQACESLLCPFNRQPQQKREETII